jgi:hypothetical protein
MARALSELEIHRSVCACAVADANKLAHPREDLNLLTN